MAVKISPVLNEQQFSDAGVLLSGGKIETYLAGSSTPAATYTASDGAVAQSNPIILNTRGEVDNSIYLTTGISYKLVLKDSLGNVLRTFNGIEGVNDSSTTVDQWINSGAKPTFVNATQFTMPGDQTSAFAVNRRVKLLVNAGTVYGYISVSAFSALTTVTVVLDSGVLDSGLSNVQLGLITATDTSFPLNIVSQPVQKQTFTAFTTTGTASAYVLTPSPAIAGNVINNRFNITLHLAPTGSPTLAVSGQTARNIKYYDATGIKRFITASVAPINWNSDVIDDGTDWVMVNPNRSQIQASAVTGYTTTSTLTAADLGGHIYYNSASAGTLTLPSITVSPAGSVISISNIIGLGTATIARGGTDVIFANGLSSQTSVSLPPGASMQLTSDGANWIQLSGNNALGVGQTWQNVTESRALATNYTNSTGKPILVVVELGVTATTTQVVLVDSVTLSSHALATAGSSGQTYTFIVPHNSSYQVQNSASALTRWHELR